LILGIFSVRKSSLKFALVNPYSEPGLFAQRLEFTWLPESVIESQSSLVSIAAQSDLKIVAKIFIAFIANGIMKGQIVPKPTERLRDDMLNLGKGRLHLIFEAIDTNHGYVF
jgi:hypothetical protein